MAIAKVCVACADGKLPCPGVGISGSIRIDNLEATTKHVLRTVGTCSGALTVTHAGYTPVVDATGVALTLVPA